MKTKYLSFLLFFALFVSLFSCSSDDNGNCAQQTWYLDADGDGYGIAGTTTEACDRPNGYAATSDDCNDSDANINPGATEIPNDGVDSDCDGTMEINIWSGATMTFTKANNADWTMEANQDRITDNVWITRADIEGLFNIVTEVSYTDTISPSDTQWAFGTTANLGTLVFADWATTHGSNPPSMVDQDMVLYLVTDNTFIDIKFTSWTTGMTGGGGGFSYERSTAN